MPLKTTPHMEVWCSPLVAQSRWRARTFGVSDTLVNLDRGPEKRGGYTGMAGVGAGMASPATGASQGGHIVEAENLEWLDVYDEDDRTRLSGYRVKPRYVHIVNEHPHDNRQRFLDDLETLLFDAGTAIWWFADRNREADPYSHLSFIGPAHADVRAQ